MSNDELYKRLDAEEAKHRAGIEELQRRIAVHQRKLRDIEGARRALASVFGEDETQTAPDEAKSGMESTEPETTPQTSSSTDDTDHVAQGRQLPDEETADDGTPPPAEEPQATAAPHVKAPEPSTDSPTNAGQATPQTSKTPARKSAAKKSGAKTASETKPGKTAVPAQRDGERRQKIVTVLKQSGEPVAARQVAEAIGLLNPIQGDVESVRNHLDRLAGAGRVTKPARGRYVWAGQ